MNHPSTESSLATILGGTKIGWHNRLFCAENTEPGYPRRPAGTAYTGELRVLAAIVEARRPDVAVEFGSLRGASLRAARRLHRPRVHVAFDHDARCAESVKATGARFVLGDWRSAGPLLPDGIEFAFVDSEHTAEATEGILTLIALHASPTCVIVVHDCDPDETGVQDVVGVERFASGRPEWRLSYLETPNRLAILTKGDL